MKSLWYFGAKTWQTVMTRLVQKENFLVQNGIFADGRHGNQCIHVLAVKIQAKIIPEVTYCPIANPGKGSRKDSTGLKGKACVKIHFALWYSLFYDILFYDIYDATSMICLRLKKCNKWCSIESSFSFEYF